MQEKKNPVIDNKREERYEIHPGHHICYIDYMRPEQGIVCLTHTEIPVALQGQGYGTYLVEEVLQTIERGGEKVVPICGFVARYIEKNPRWMSLVADGIEVV